MVSPVGTVGYLLPRMGAIIFVAGFFIVLFGTVMFFAMRRGSGTAITKSEPSRDTRRATIMLVTAVVVGVGIAVPAAVTLSNEASGSASAPGGKELTADQKKGRELFGLKCATCHTLADAGAVGKVGPNLDTRILPEAAIVEVILKGRAAGNGQMPPALYTGEEARQVADYVERVAGR